MSHVVVSIVFNNLMWEVIVRFLDIGGIVDRYSLNSLSTDMINYIY